MKTISEIKKEVDENYPLSYVKDLYEAIVDADCKIAWFKTKDAFKEIGEKNCDKKREEQEKEKKMVENKLKFVIKYFGLK